MTEWHVTPDYIVNNWTQELLDLMIDKLVDRRKPKETPDGKVTDKLLFQQASNMIEVKHGD